MDADKIQEFCIHHVEKMILVLVVGASVFLVYLGLQQENILETHQPDRLIADAKQVRAEVDEDHNDVVLAERRPDFDIDREIKRRRTPVEPSGYSVVTWEPMDATSSIRRADPTLAPPMALQVAGVLAPMALRSSDGVYALSDLEAADAIEVEKEPERPQRRSRRSRRGGGGYPGDEGMDEMYEMFDMEMDEGNEEGYPGMDSYESMTGSTGLTRRLKDPIGFRPTGTRHILHDTQQKPIPGIGWFIAGTAVMPYKELHEAYKDALAQADEYDPRRRDQPKFIGYQLQRADVTGKTVDQLQEADWINRDGRTECIRDAVVLWSGFCPELVPKDYRADTTLTMWIPPVMLTDYSTFSLHPLIPMMSRRDLELAAEKEAKQNVSQEVDETDIVIGDSAGTSYDSSYDSEMDDMYGEDAGMYSGGYAAMQVEVNPPDYKLIRFYDFAIDQRAQDPNSPKPGREYVYRVRVGIEDPNFPKEPALQVRGSNLTPDAYVRVMNLMGAVENDDKPIEKRKELSQRWTAWSAPSDRVSLPSREKVYAGPVAGERKIRQVRVGERLVPYEAEAPKANLVISQFNPEYSSNLSMFLTDITEGSVLSHKAEFNDIVDPISLDVKKLPDAVIVSDATVIDIDGGIPLGIQEGEGLVTPSLMLMYDSQGGLKVHDEVDDQEFYRIESFAEERGK